MSLLEAKKASLVLGGQAILRELTLVVPARQTLVVIGESGCGKTMLLKLLVGLLTPTTGQVLFDGRDWAEQSASERAMLRRRMGFLFQGAALFDSLTVYDNVAYPLRTLHQWDEAAIAQRVRQRLDEVGLASSTARKMPAELSGGMRKRVGLARALALDPEVMLYDEPTTGLDPVMIGVINKLIIQTRQQRPMTSVIVTHEMKTIQAVADRVVMLAPLSQLTVANEQVIFDGSPAQLGVSSDERIRRFVA